MPHVPASITERAYVTLLRGARLVAPALAGGSSKLARGIRARDGVVEGLETWAREHRRPARPLVWFHAPSVGEGLQAQAVLEAVRSRRGDIQSLFTHFSPSAEGLAGRVGADWSGYLPWDLPRDVGVALAAARPDLLVFTKTEVWPTLARAAAAAGVPVALVAATLPASSSRRGRVARTLLRPSMGRLDALLAIAAEDAGRFQALGVRRSVVRVVGDPGIDSAARRAAGADPAAPWLSPFHEEPAPTLVAGSTWPPDEGVLVDAATRVRERMAGLRLVVAPHEPDASHVEPLEDILRRRGWTPLRLSRMEEEGRIGGANAVVVDRVGVLAHLYTVGSAAYVGGGFHDDGLHSVLEPAAAGIPVAFGPSHHNSRAASDLLRLGGAVVVENAAELASAVERWLADEALGRRSGAAGSGYIESHLGAAGRSAEALLGLLGG